MANPYDVITKIASVTAAGTSVDFGVMMAAVTILNLGTDDVWGKLDGNPSAADTNGQFRIPTRHKFVRINRHLMAQNSIPQHLYRYLYGIRQDNSGPIRRKQRR